jgi:hypothetical protein
MGIPRGEQIHLATTRQAWPALAFVSRRACGVPHLHRRPGLRLRLFHAEHAVCRTYTDALECSGSLFSQQILWWSICSPNLRLALNL